VYAHSVFRKVPAIKAMRWLVDEEKNTCGFDTIGDDVIDMHT
jgi:hypothetical protein